MSARLQKRVPGTVWGEKTFTGITIATFLFLYLPLVVLVAFSFSSSRVITFPFGDFTFSWYRELLADSDIHSSILNSLIVAGSAVPACLLLGVPFAFALDRFQFPGKRVLERTIMIPLAVPGLITGVAILLMLNRHGLQTSLATVVIGHTIWLLPIVVTLVYARLRTFDRTLEEASMDLGAGRARTFVTVTLPNIRTALIGSAMLTFVLSFDEIPVTFFLTGPDNTLPMHIWSMMREGITPKINAIGTLTIGVSFLLIVLGLRLVSARSGRRRTG